MMQMDAHWRTMSNDQRKLREEAERQLEKRADMLQREIDNEKMRVSEELANLAKILERTREQLNEELSVRKHEAAMILRGMDDIRATAKEERLEREDTDAKQQKELNAIAAALNAEARARAEAERQAALDRTSLYKDMQQEIGAREAMEAKIVSDLRQEAGLRESAEFKLAGRLQDETATRQILGAKFNDDLRREASARQTNEVQLLSEKRRIAWDLQREAARREANDARLAGSLLR